MRFFLILFLLLLKKGEAQVNSKSLPDIVNKKIILVGENHTFKENNSIRYAFLKNLHENNIFPKYIVLEFGHGTAFILNKYFETGNKELIELLFPLNLKLGQDFYNELKKLNDVLPDSKKFKFVGIDHDYDYEAMHLSLRYLLLNDKEFSQDTIPNLVFENLEDDERINFLIGSLMNKKDPTIWGNNYLKRDINLILDILNSKDSMLIINRFGDHYHEGKLILKGYLLTQSSKHPLMYGLESNVFKEKREIFLTNNIYDLFKNDTSAFITGQFGAYHTIFKPEFKAKNKKVYKRLSDMLNCDPTYKLTNGRVSSNLILYKSFLKSQSKTYHFDKNRFTQWYQASEPNILYIEKCTNGLTDNFLLYKLY